MSMLQKDSLILNTSWSIYRVNQNSWCWNLLGTTIYFFNIAIWTINPVQNKATIQIMQ